MLGAGIDEVTQAVKEASEIYPFMKWLEPYIEPRKTVSNFKNVGAEQEFDEDTGEESRPITPASETDTEPASNSSCISRYCGELECSRFQLMTYDCFFEFKSAHSHMYRFVLLCYMDK